MEPSDYTIRIEGHLSASWLQAWEGLAVRHDAGGQTVICGPLDQAALYGLLARLSRLNVTIISVRQMKDGESHSPGRTP